MSQTLRNVAAIVALLALLPCSAYSQQPADSHGDSHSEAADDHAAGGHAADHSDADHSNASEHGDGDHSGDHSGAHHDPTDLSHQNAGAQIGDPSEVKSDLAIWTFVVFLCLLALLAKFAWGPVVSGLEKREQGIAAKIDEAQRSAENAAKQLQQYEAKLAAAAEEAREIVAGARKDAEGAKDRILAEAQEAAERERTRAVEDINAAKNVALQDISERSVDLAVLVAKQLIGREVKATDRGKLIRDALEQIPGRN